MNVGELKKMLEKYPDSMKVIHSYCSDYIHIEEGDFRVIQGVDKDSYVMTTHPTMSAENKASIEEFLFLTGN